VSLTLFTQNLLELSTTTVTVNPAAAAASPINRVYDRFKSLQYVGGSIAQTDIDADLGAASTAAVTAWADFSHTINGVSPILYGDAAVIGTTQLDTFAATGADFLRTIASQTLRYWRQRIPAMAAAPKLGEYFLGVPQVVATAPEYPSDEIDQGNVSRDESPAGFVWKSSKGATRYRLNYHWAYLPDSDWTILKTAFDQALQSAKPFPMLDNDGTLRWVEFVDGSLTRRRVFQNTNDVTVSFLEAL
jgi:hypothetical protein